MTTHVRVMYMLDKHVHALNLLDINIDRSNFPEHVRVWRLILKKNHTCNLDITNQGYKIYGSFMPSLCLRCLRFKSVIPPLQNRSKSVP
jgi:hypothetical protein